MAKRGSRGESSFDNPSRPAKGWKPGRPTMSSGERSGKAARDKTDWFGRTADFRGGYRR